MADVNASDSGPAVPDTNRTAVLELLALIAAGMGLLVVLMYLLNWAAQATGSGGVAAEAVNFEERSISVIVLQEPPQLDSTKSTDQISGSILGHVMEGLLRYDVNNRLVPGVAERWNVEADGATFWLRQNARWSDGEPVTAHDFVFAWRTALLPETASRYAFILFPVRNAEAINTGKADPLSLGVTAVNDFELRVEFEKPIAFFDKLVAFSTYYPVREDFHTAMGSRYGADADKLLYNGAFVLSDWVHNASMRMEKNPHYWNRDSIYLNSINVPFITQDKQASVNLFKDGRVAATDLDAETLPDALEQRWQIKRFKEGSVFYVEFNHRPGRLTTNLNLRRALQHALDPAELVYRVIKIPGYLPGETLFPSWLKGVRGTFREEYPPPRREYNPEKARQYLAAAKQELGLAEWPDLVLLSGDSPVASKQAEYYQNVLKKNLGLTLKIDKQIFKQRLAKMTAGEFDMVLAGWGPDFDDALTYGDLFASWNLNNRGRYNNPELDRFVRIAQESLDQQERMDAFGNIQRILYEDAVILPDYERGRVYVKDPRVVDMVRRTIGPDPDYSRVRLVEAGE